MIIVAVIGIIATALVLARVVAEILIKMVGNI